LELISIFRIVINFALGIWNFFFKTNREIAFEWIATLDNVEDVFNQCIALGGSLRLPWKVRNIEIDSVELNRSLHKIKVESKSRKIRKLTADLQKIVNDTWASSKQTHIYLAFDNGNKAFSLETEDSLRKFADLQRSNANKGKVLVEKLKHLIEKRIVKK
jgi:hypothetical protein